MDCESRTPQVLVFGAHYAARREAWWRELVSGFRMNLERLRDVPRLPVLEEEPE